MVMTAAIDALGKHAVVAQNEYIQYSILLRIRSVFEDVLNKVIFAGRMKKSAVVETANLPLVN